MQLSSSEIERYIQIAKKNHKEGNLIDANQIYKNLINKKIYTYDLLISYGLFNKEIRNLDIAKNLFSLSIKKYPLIIKPYLLLAEILRLENKFNAALKILQVAKNIEKNNSDVDYNLSILYKANKLFKEAILHINNAIKKSPEITIYKILKADILIDSFQHEEASKLLFSLRVGRDDEVNFQKQILISRILIQQKNFIEAEKTLLNLKRLFNNHKILYLNLSDLYFLNKELQKGILILKEGIKKFPKFIPLRFNLAVMYRNSGLIDNSIQTHLDILKLDKLNSNSYYELSTIYDFSNHIEQLNNLLNIKMNDLTNIQKIFIGFSKSNLYHYKKDYSKSSFFLRIANEEKLRLQPSDLKRKLNTGEFYKNLKLTVPSEPSIETDNNRYLFIVGMPRSGSTLLESILSLNSQVQDMGEVFFLEESIKETKDIKNVKEFYQKKVNFKNITNSIFTDKNLFNFLYCSVIYNFFPNAKIIHCKRNPLDNILSIYRTNFLNQSFSSSLEDITRLYTYHLELMRYYKDKFGSIIYTYEHDKVVQNPEKNIKKLIEWLNWEWDEKYLSPQKSKRNVFTASSAQVRKKINSNSLGYWKKYEDLLKPVLDLIPKSDLLNG